MRTESDFLLLASRRSFALRYCHTSETVLARGEDEGADGGNRENGLQRVFPRMESCRTTARDRERAQSTVPESIVLSEAKWSSCFFLCFFSVVGSVATRPPQGVEGSF